MVPLLRDPQVDWPHVSVTHLAEPGSYGLSEERWRYIHYANGDEELYDCQADPYEWTNLVNVVDHTGKLEELRTLAPTTLAPLVQPKDDSLPQLKWRAASESRMPVSKPDGDTFDIVLLNQFKDQVNIYAMDRRGERRTRGSIASGWRIHRSTRPGTVWLITDSTDKPLGYFLVGDRTARGVIPSTLEK